MAAKILFALTAEVLFIQVAVCRSIGDSIATQTIDSNSNAYNNKVYNTDIDVNNFISNGGSTFGVSPFNVGNAINNELLLNNVASGYNGLGSFGLDGYGGVSSVAAPVGISSTTLAGFGGYNIVASSPLTVTSISPFGPSGLAVASENTLEGVLTINGQLPFLSAVAFEGALPTAGSGVATCGCGNGQVGIIGEGPVVAPGVINIGPNPNGIYW